MQLFQPGFDDPPAPQGRVLFPKTASLYQEAVFINKILRRTLCFVNFEWLDVYYWEELGWSARFYGWLEVAVLSLPLRC